MNRSPTSQRRGVVLIVVLVLVVLIALAGFGFAESMSTERDAARIVGLEMQADQALLSAELYLQQFATRPAHVRADALRQAGVCRGIPIERSVNLTEAAIAIPADAWQFSMLARKKAGDDSFAEVDAFRFGFENESEKLHLEAVLKWDQQQPGIGRGILLRLPGMTPEIADAILDAMDADDRPREFGFESSIADPSSGPAYRVMNRLPATLDDLLLVRGVTRELLYGQDRNRNFRIDSDEQSVVPDSGGQFDLMNATSGVPSALGDSVERPLGGWADLLTVHSAERNLTSAGLSPIHLNNPNLTVLASQLEAVVPSEVARFVLLMRQYGFAVGSGSTSAGDVVIDFAVPPRFRIESAAAVVDARVVIPGSPAIAVRSPLRSGSEELAELLPLFLAETTAFSEKVLRGRVNIHEAPESVVRMLPFFSEETADVILSRRRSLDDNDRQSTLWLLTEGVLSPASFAQIEPWLTVGGDVLRTQVVVFRRSGGPIRRVDMVFDGASPKPRRVEWRDLRGLGTGFSLSILEVAQNE